VRITPATELETRINRLQSEIESNDLDAILIIQNADLFYFTGSIQQGVLYVPASGVPLYMVRKDIQRARMEAGLKEIVPFRSIRDLPGVLNEFGVNLPEKAGMELDVVPVATYQRFQKVLGNCIVTDATPLIRKGHQGITRMRGFNSELFYGHIFSGVDSAVPAYLDAPLGGLGVNPSIGQGSSYKTIRPNEPICVDFVGAFDGYLSDQTRIFCIGGLPDQLVEAYEDMVAVQNRMLELAVPGASWGGVYNECYQLACEMGYQDHFMGSKGAQVSFIGHGISLYRPWFR
jgi:Xaa-Pro dipeptidase